MSEDKFYNVLFEEQEFLLGGTFADKQLTFYTSKPNLTKKMIKLLGEPTRLNYINGKISDGRWDFNFDDKRTNIVFSKGKVIGYHKIKN